MLKFNVERTYGVEIEIARDGMRYDVHSIANTLNIAGINAQAESYNHTTRRHWKVTTDSSCGYEIVSPILKGYEGLEELKRVLEVLNAMDCKINRDCGIHVHHGVNDYSLKNFQNLFKMYVKYEKNIDAVLPNSRRANNNSFCRSMLYTHGTVERTIEKINEAKSVQQLENVWYTRYVKLNIQSYVKYGTIEFRQHAGSLSFEKISNWILFTQVMVERSKVATVSSKLTINSEGTRGFAGLATALRADRKDSATDEVRAMVKFFKKRELELAAC